MTRLSLTLAIALTFSIASGLDAQTTITYQQGVNGYNSAFDRLISVANSQTGGSVDSVFIDGDPEDANRADYLIRFDNIVGAGNIPVGATILDASLRFRTSSAPSADSPESYNVYRLTQSFSSASTLDGDFGNNDFLFTPFVDGVEPEQGEADWNVGTFDHPVGDGTMDFESLQTANVTRAVQSWVNGDTNFGFAVVSDHRDNDNGWGVYSTGASDTSFRPELSITYTTDPFVEVAEFQQGLNGYNGTKDVFLRADPNETSIDGSTVSEEFLDGSNGTDSFDDPYMVQFDISGISNANDILKAELIIKTGISSGASDAAGSATYSIHQMLTDFDTSSEYGDFAGDLTAMELAGQIGSSVALFQDIDEAELMSADITSMVENWLLDGQTNHGIYIGADGTSNGWQIFSSGAIDPDLAPMLRITYSSIPEPAAMGLLCLAGLAALTRRKRD